ncbi:MAG: YoaK family protein [Candidatus Nanopelagicales bacterium]
MKDRSIVPGLFLLTAACGVIDATTFLAFDMVFAEIMTGNLMFLAFGIGQGNAIEAVPNYVIPLVSFGVGSLVGGAILMGKWFTGQRRWGFVAVAALVSVACLLTLWWQPESTSNEAVIVVIILSFAMGVQNALVLFHAVPDIATNVMTLTYVRLLASWSVIGGNNERWRYRLGSLAVFFVSAALGAAAIRVSPGLGLGVAVALYVVAMPWLLWARKPVGKTASS